MKVASRFEPEALASLEEETTRFQTLSLIDEAERLVLDFEDAQADEIRIG